MLSIRVVPNYTLINNIIHLFLKLKAFDISATSSKHEHGAEMRRQSRSTQLVSDPLAHNLM